MKSLFAAGLVIVILQPSNSRAETPWEAFLNNPSAQSAARVDKVEYTAAGDRNLLFSDYDILDTLVRYGEPAAVDLAFRLLRTSDGHLAESLLISLGLVVRSRPDLFLSEMADHKFSDFQRILGNTTEAYYDRPDATIAELEARMKSLAQVRSRRLRQIRDQCIAALSSLIAEERERKKLLQEGTPQ